MTQRQRRIRTLVAERQRIAAREREIANELRPLENEESWSRGFAVPIRGDRLVAEMDRVVGRLVA